MRLWRNAPAVRGNMYTRHEISPDEHRSWWARTVAREDQQYFMYELAGVAMGVVSLNGIDRINSNCSWAFYAAPNASRGAGVRMEYLALTHVFDELGLHKLSCEVLALNASVIRLHQKFGFKVEGIFRQHHKRDACFVDVYRLGLLQEEWAVKRREMFGKVIGMGRT